MRRRPACFCSLLLIIFFLAATVTVANDGPTRLLRMYLDPKEEFKQIFNEGWRNQRDYFYVENIHGSDWPGMKEM